MNQILAFFISYCVQNAVFSTALYRESIVFFSPKLAVIQICSLRSCNGVMFSDYCVCNHFSKHKIGFHITHLISIQDMYPI